MGNNVCKLIYGKPHCNKKGETPPPPKKKNKHTFFKELWRPQNIPWVCSALAQKIW